VRPFAGLVGGLVGASCEWAHLADGGRRVQASGARVAVPEHTRTEKSRNVKGRLLCTRLNWKEQTKQTSHHIKSTPGKALTKILEESR
jgi:hypothetical protein